MTASSRRSEAVPQRGPGGPHAQAGGDRAGGPGAPGPGDPPASAAPNCPATSEEAGPRPPDPADAPDAALLTALLDGMETALCAFTADGTVTHWNGEAERLLGWSAEDAVGRPGLGGWAVRAEDADAVHSRLLAALRSPGRRARTVEEFALRARDGHRVLVRAQSCPVLDTDGRPTGVYCAFGEAQAQVDLERSLALSEALLSDASWGVVLVDADLRPALLNGYAARALGASRATVLGRPLGDLLVSGAAEVEGALQHVLAEGPPPEPADLWVTVRSAELDDPRRCWRGGFVRLASPLGEEPVPLGVAWLFRDVTGVKQAERDASLLRFRAHQLHRAGRAAADCEDPVEAVSLHLEFALAGFADHGLLDTLDTPGASTPGLAADGPGGWADDEPRLVRALTAPAGGAEVSQAYLAAPADGATSCAPGRLPVGYLPEHPAVQAVRRQGAVRASAGQALPQGWAAARKWPEEAAHSLCVALRSRGRTLGVVTFLRGPSRRPFDRADVSYAEETAARIAGALDLAVLLRRAAAPGPEAGRGCRRPAAT